MDADAVDILDPRLLERTVRELVPGGPVLPRKETAEVVAGLREAAETAVDLVLDVMRLEPAAADAARTRAAAGPILVVDRLGWAKATGQSLTAMVSGALAPAARGALEAGRIPNTLEAAAVLSVLSTRVLGQFDPFGGGPHPEGSGRLLLVAPSIAQAEAAMAVEPRDFRLWVALHESTHRLQFAAAPWLRDHLTALLTRLLGDEAALAPAARAVGPVLRRLPEILRGETELIDVLTGPDTREVLDQVLAVMSLLEGHADVVMDAVGARVIPSLPQIRARFESRRDEGVGPGGAVGRLLGMDTKLRQYREGAAFVRAVVREVGHEGLAAVFDSPQSLPTAAEIARPADWLARIHPDTGTSDTGTSDTDSPDACTTVGSVAATGPSDTGTSTE